MTTDVIFFHGAGAGAYEEDAEMAADLGARLGDEYAVVTPRLPDGDDPDDRQWLATIGDAIARATPPVVLVGHSAGGYMLLKYLATAAVTTPIRAVCIIAAPYPGAEPAWTFDGFTLPDGFASCLPQGAAIRLYASEDDDTVPFAHRDLYAADIPASLTRTTSGGHQLGNNLTLVAEDIRSL